MDAVIESIKPDTTPASVATVSTVDKKSRSASFIASADSSRSV